MYVLNPKYTGVLFTDPVGIGMLIAAVVAMIVGFLWMRKIIDIEI
jgi:tight adherence protein B